MTKKEIRAKKRWYRKNKRHIYIKVKINRFKNFIKETDFKFLEFFKWVLIDIIRGKEKPMFGIYQFVALPGEGKTISMVAHIERALKRNPSLKVFTNFNYINENASIRHWTDIVKYSLECKREGNPCVIAMDEIRIQWDSSSWKDFPAEMLSLLSFNRKFRVQFLCSSQIYERIPKKIRDIANYTVICKNKYRLDRKFINFYFTKSNYDSAFSGERAKAEFVKSFVATDKLYAKYNTLQQIDKMVKDVKQEKNEKKKAFELLFGEKEKEVPENS